MEHISKALIKDLDSYPKSTETLTKSSETAVINWDIIESCNEQKAKHGYSPNPHCKVCNGFGRIHTLKDNGRTDHSNLILCQAPNCLAEQRRLYRTTEPYIRDRGVSKFSKFEDFKFVLGAESTLEAFKDIALNPDAPPLLLVYGTTGNGKTHLCEATAIKLIERGIDCKLWTVADMISKLKESIQENTTELLMNKLKKQPALILDEWGQNYGSQWEEQKLEEIVIAREREGLITIITTNLEPDVLPERIVSRWRDTTQARIIANRAADFRPKKKAKKGG